MIYVPATLIVTIVAREREAAPAISVTLYNFYNRAAAEAAQKAFENTHMANVNNTVHFTIIEGRLS